VDLHQDVDLQDKLSQSTSLLLPQSLLELAVQNSTCNTTQEQHQAEPIHKMLQKIFRGSQNQKGQDLLAKYHHP